MKSVYTGFPCLVFVALMVILWDVDFCICFYPCSIWNTSRSSSNEFMTPFWSVERRTWLNWDCLFHSIIFPLHSTCLESYVLCCICILKITSESTDTFYCTTKILDLINKQNQNSEQIIGLSYQEISSINLNHHYISNCAVLCVLLLFWPNK